MMRFKSDRRYEINLRALQVTNKKLIWMRDQKKKKIGQAFYETVEAIKNGCHIQ